MPISATGTPRTRPGRPDGETPSDRASLSSGLTARSAALCLPAGGFTLLELLVVIVIIGIIAAMLTLSVGIATPDTTMAKEVTRLENLVRLATEEAVLSGRELGLTFYDTEYEFSTLDPESTRWRPITDEEPFTPHRFPPGTVVDLAVESRSVRLAMQRPPPPEDEQPAENSATQAEADDAADTQAVADDTEKVTRDEPDPRIPQILLLSSGDVVPAFELRLRPGIGREGMRLRVSENGRIERLEDER